MTADSCDSRRRRRARPHIRYSGSESTSSAMNIVSRSFDAQNAIMPPSANSVSGNTSVCMTVAVWARSWTVPGRMPACATSAPPGSTTRSEISSTAPTARASSVPQRNSAGLSIEIAPLNVFTPPAGASLDRVLDQPGARRDDRQQAQPDLHAEPRALRGERLHQHADARRAEDDQHRQHGVVVDRRHLHRWLRRLGQEDVEHGYLPPWTADSVCCTVGVTVSSTGFG